MNVFPNLVVLGRQVRTIRPIRHDRTEVLLARALLERVPDERAFEAFHSPQGGGIHDDFEMFSRVTEGLRCDHDPWLLFQRGRHRRIVANVVPMLTTPARSRPLRTSSSSRSDFTRRVRGEIEPHAGTAANGGYD